MSIVALVGSYGTAGIAESPARTVVVDAPATPSPNPITEQAQTTVAERAQTTVQDGGSPAPNSNKGPDSSARSGDSSAKGKAKGKGSTHGSGNRDTNAGKPGSGSQDG